MHAKSTHPESLPEMSHYVSSFAFWCVVKLLLQGQLKLMEELFRFSLLNNWKIKSCCCAMSCYERGREQICWRIIIAVNTGY